MCFPLASSQLLLDTTPPKGDSLAMLVAIAHVHWRLFDCRYGIISHAIQITSVRAYTIRRNMTHRLAQPWARSACPMLISHMKLTSRDCLDDPGYLERVPADRRSPGFQGRFDKGRLISACRIEPVIAPVTDRSRGCPKGGYLSIKGGQKASLKRITPAPPPEQFRNFRNSIE